MFSKKDRAWAKYRKEAKRPVPEPTPTATRRQLAKHITPQDGDLARSLGLRFEDLSILSASGAVRRVCPAHLEDLPRESLTVTLGGGVLLLSCDRNCSSADIVAALRADGVKPHRPVSVIDVGGSTMSDPEELIKLFTDQPALSESDINLCVMIMRDRDLAEAIGLSDGDLYLLGHGGEKWRPCPAHQGDADNMSVRMSDTGRLLFHCYSHGCSSQEIVSALRADAGRR